MGKQPPWWIGISAVLVAILIAFNAERGWRNVREVDRAADRTEAALETVGSIRKVMVTLLDAETGLRGYLITGQPEFLQPYNDARSRIDGEMQILQRRYAVGHPRRADLDRLQELVDEALAILGDYEAARTNVGFDAARALVASGDGRRTMDAVRQHVRAMNDAEEALLTERESGRLKSYRIAVGTGLVASVLGVVLVFAFALGVRRTLRARAEVADLVRAHRNRLRQTLASIGDAVITTDEKGRITFLNAIAESLTGWTTDEAQGKPLQTVFAIVDELTRQAVEDPVQKVLARGEIVGLANHTLLVSRSGEHHPIDDSAAPIRDELGAVVGVVLVFRDVAERRATERAVALSEARKSAMLASAMDAVITIDHQGVIVDFNPAAERMFGWQRAEVVGRAMQDLILPARWREDHRRGLERYLETGDGPVLDRLLELTALRRDGAEFPVELSITRIAIEGPPMFTGFVRDITERRAAERSLHESLDLVVFQRDVALALSHDDRLEVALARCAESVKVHLDAALARIWTLSEDGRTLELQASAGVDTRANDLDAVVPVGQYKIGLIAEKRQPMLTNAVVGDPRIRDQEWARREGLVAFAGHPLLVEGRAVGVMGVYARHALSKDAVLAMESVASSVALAVVRRKAEHDLFESRERLRVTLGSIGDAVITTDVEGRVTFLNAVAAQMTGWPPGEAEGRPLEEVFTIVDEDSRRPVESPAARALSTGQVVGLENHTLLIARGGAEIAIDDSAAPIRDDVGALAGVVLIFRDVSDRRASERRIHELGQRFSALIEATAAIVWTADETGAFTTEQRSWAEYTGQKREEYAGYGWTRAIHPDEREAIAESWRRASARMETFHTEGRIWHAPTGAYRWFYERAVPLFHADGRLREWVGMIEDVEESRRVQEELARAAAELSETARKKDEFLALLAHELRNPLAPIRNAVQLVRLAAGDSEPLREACAMMERQIAQMVRLVDDLLDVSRISRGRIELDRERVDLAVVVAHAVDGARPLAHEKRQHVSVALPDEPLYVDGDAIRLAQAVGNVLNNACKYSNPGGRIDVELAREDGFATVRVRDEGIGIAADQLGAIFEMFTQIDTSLTRAQSGLGIGLTLARQLVEMHGGSASAHSEGLGRGSEFVLRLPLASAPAPKAPATPAPEPPRSGARRVLIVDDNQDSAISLAMVLRRDVPEVHVAHDGEEALAVAERTRPDVVLLDLGLPKKSGYDVCRELRARPGGDAVVIVALTGWGQEEDRRLTRAAGFDAHLVKPVERAALLEVLAELRPA